MSVRSLVPWRRRFDSGSAGFRQRKNALAGWIALIALACLLALAPLTWATAGILGALVLTVMAVQPVVGLVIVALAIPFGNLRPLPLPGANGVDLLVGLTLVAWLARCVANRQIVIRIPPLTVPVLCLLGAFALSLTGATSWREGLSEWLKWAEFAVLYLVATQMLNRRRVAWIVGALFVAGLLEVALGAYQFIRQVGPEEFVLMGRFMRAYGTFSQPNPYAGYLGYLTPVAASLAIGALWGWWRRQRSSDLWIGLLTTGVTIALIAGIGMSWSRGSWLGLAAALLVVVALRNRRTALLAAVAMVVLFLVLNVFGTQWLPSVISARLGDLGGLAVGGDPSRIEITDENFAILERLAHWQAGLNMFGDHPWLGVGIGNFAVVYPAYAMPHWYEALGHAHNVYINFLAETGVVGTGTFVALWVCAAWLAWRTAVRSTGLYTALALGVLGTLTYCTIHNIFDNLFVAHMQLQLALLLAALTADPGA